MSQEASNKGSKIKQEGRAIRWDASTHAAHLKDGLIDLAAGVSCGVANVCAGQPLDTVKVKMQAFPTLYSNWITCLTQNYRLDGIRGLYAGASPALIANIAENAALFTAYGYCQKTIAYVAGTNDIKNMSSMQNACSGSLAAVISATFLCPTELVKCRLQVQREINPTIKSTPLTVCRQIYQTGGISAFSTGLLQTMARDVPGYFCFFGAYETCRQLMTKPGQNKDDIGSINTAVAGAVAGVAFWTLVFPVDVVKSKMQIQGGTANEVMKKILRKECIGGLYKGLTAALLRTCVASACVFLAYENTKKFLHTNL